MKAQWEEKISESLVEQFYNEQTQEEIEAGFSEVLSFGTAGIRSTFGLGPGRMNKFTIQKFALGLAHYLNSKHDSPSVVIHFDTRHLSKSFAVHISEVLATNGVQTILSENYKSTPELSFAVRYLKATAGIMITASHNPRNYNGIKVYGSDGGQLLTGPSLELSEYIDAVNDPLNIEVRDMKALIEEKSILPFNIAIRDAYKKAVKSLVGNFQTSTNKTILTSLHGTSLPILAEILDELDYENYVIETNQSKPDGNFPTVNIANPELEDTFELGEQLAIKEEAQLVIATDPDADRLGIVERYNDGSMRYFNGNEIGLILLKLRSETLKAAPHKFMIKSVVTSALSEQLAKSLNIEVNDVLTGFKYISEQLKHVEGLDKQLVLAYEESHGYLVNDFSRDKDAIQTATLLIKYKEQLAQKNQTFKDILETIYEEFGHYQDKTLSPTFYGEVGKLKIRQIMDKFTQIEAVEIPGLTPLYKEDYAKKQRLNNKTGEKTIIELPETNLIKFIYEEGFIAVRPSGTEPKMKVYFSLNVSDLNQVIMQFNRQYQIVEE